MVILTPIKISQVLFVSIHTVYSWKKKGLLAGYDIDSLAQFVDSRPQYASRIKAFKGMTL
jgi:hypothetical protein